VPDRAPRSSLEAVLLREGISINQLARQLGINVNGVWKVANGSQAMTRARAERYAEALRALGAKTDWKEIL